MVCCRKWIIFIYSDTQSRSCPAISWRWHKKSFLWPGRNPEQSPTVTVTQLLEDEKIKACKFHTFPWTCNTFFHHFWTVNLLVVQTPIIETPTSWSGRRSSVYLLIISVWWEMNPQQCALPRQEGLPAKAKHSLMKALLSQRSENHSWV